MLLGTQIFPLTLQLQVFIQKLALSFLVCNLPPFIIFSRRSYSNNLAHHYKEILSSNDSESIKFHVLNHFLLKISGMVLFSALASNDTTYIMTIICICLNLHLSILCCLFLKDILCQVLKDLMYSFIVKITYRKPWTVWLSWVLIHAPKRLPV